jgi:hypothetical protein
MRVPLLDVLGTETRALAAERLSVFDAHAENLSQHALDCGLTLTWLDPAHKIATLLLDRVEVGVLIELQTTVIETLYQSPQRASRCFRLLSLLDGVAQLPDVVAHLGERVRALEADLANAKGLLEVMHAFDEETAVTP